MAAQAPQRPFWEWLVQDVIGHMEMEPNVRADIWLVITFLGAVCLQAIMNPLGGVWQADVRPGENAGCDLYLGRIKAVLGIELPHCPGGEAVLAYSKYKMYATYKTCLILGSGACLIIVFLMIYSGGRFLNHLAGIAFVKTTACIIVTLVGTIMILATALQLPEHVFALIWDDVNYSEILYLGLGVLIGSIPYALKLLLSLRNAP